ncbi:hypothetical protein CAR00_10700 [Salmonella enterica]|nr:hypothetical protein [Salmonella enterica]ECS5296820.1 hypothetical protein [Salmonella enterica subsp. enterica serovar Wedding]
MKVWIIVGGTYYEQSEWIGGVFSTKEKAESAMEKMELSTDSYIDIVECDEIDNPKTAEIVSGRYS